MTCEQASFRPTAEIVWIEDEAQGTSAPDDGAEYTVGELATQLGITPRALRFYESKGLLSPSRHEGMRIYRQADRERLSLILKAKKFGFTLVEIGEMIDAQDGQPAGGGLKLSLTKCREQISLLEQQRAEIDVALAELRRIQSALEGRGDER